jgi:CRISPR-associated protein Cmr6
MPRLAITLDENLVSRGVNKGLLLDRFVAPKSSNRESNTDLLRIIASIPSDTAVYRQAYLRWRRASQAMPNTLRLLATLPGRMALGLGIESVHEIGCRLHHTYGVPVIPGSSLKGALRARMKLEASHPKYAEFAPVESYLFGGTEESGALQVFDAWWVPPQSGNASGLAVDVVTPHHQDYNGKKLDGQGHVLAPSDMDSPIPVNFLTITGTFYFVFGFDRIPAGELENWKEYARLLISDVLGTRGLGAKKRAGYGRFAPLTDAGEEG